MPGKIKQLIDYLIQQRAANNPMGEKVIKAKLILKGINPKKYDAQSEDDPAVLAKLQAMMTELKVEAAPSRAPEGRMLTRTAFSRKTPMSEVLTDLANQLGGFDPKLLVFFASPCFDPAQLSRGLQARFAGAQVFGCTSAGELVSGRMLAESVVVMAFSGESILDASIQVVDAPTDPAAVKAAFDGFGRHFGTSPAAMSPRDYVGIVLVDGLGGAEERLIETIGDLTDVTFIGGSAGDDLKFAATHLYARGNSYARGAVLVMLKPAVPFSFIKTQSFRSLGKTLTVTRANPATREVLEFNGRPAAQAYAETLGTTIEQAPERFMSNPVGLVIDGEPFVRSPQQIRDRGSMAFYCGVREGMELCLLESTDIINDTQAAIDRARRELGNISAIINFNCILRTLELQQRGQAHDYGELFANIPTVGFSTYGEQFIGHLNQTATMLVFG